MKKSIISTSIYIILVLILFALVIIFYPCKGYFSCDRLQNICRYERVSVFNREYIKTAKLSSLSNAQYTSLTARHRHDDLMYLIDYDKDRDDNVFVQFSFPTLHDARDTGNKFDAYLKSDEQEFKYTDKGQARTFRNIMLFLAVCLLISLANFYFNPQNDY